MKATRQAPLRQPDHAFTLIELLIVISIIAILASLAFPAVQGALGQGKKAQARNDVNQIAAAFKAYQLEYGRLPGANTSGDGEAMEGWVSVLIGSNATLNPRNIVFFEPKVGKSGQGGLNGSTYNDPWGSPYQVSLDYNYDNKIATNTPTGTNATYFTTVVVVSGGPDTNMATGTDNISNVK